MWKDALVVYGPHKTLCNRFVRWSQAGVFDWISSELAIESCATDAVIIYVTYVKAHRPRRA